MAFQSISNFFEKHKEPLDLFKDLYETIDQANIRQTVDDEGINSFIESCAQHAGWTGLATGVGGPATFIIGISADVINNLAQQFRVTSGIFYSKKRRSPEDFSEFIQIVGLSLGVEVSRVMTKKLVMVIINKIITRMAIGSAGKVFPFIGGVVGAGSNYIFIKGIAKAVNRANF